MSELEKRACKICERLWTERVEWFGGYPDEWVFRNIDGVAHIIVASVEDGRPSLLVQPLDEFVDEWEAEFADRDTDFADDEVSA